MPFLTSVSKTARRLIVAGSLLGGVMATFALAWVLRSRASRTPMISIEAVALPLPQPARVHSVSVSHHRIVYGFALATCVLFVLSAWFFRYFADPVTKGPITTPDLGILFMLAGGAALGITLGLGRRKTGSLEIYSLPLAKHHALTRDQWIIAGAGFLTLGLLAACNIVETWQVSVHFQMALLVVGVALVTAGLGGVSLDKIGGYPIQARSGGGKPTSFLRLSWVGWLLLAILLVALVARLWQLETAVHMFIDEMHFVDALDHIRDGEAVRLLVPFDGIAAFTSVFPYLQWGSVTLLGASLTGLRMVSVLMGVLTIPAAYLLARVLFDRPTALMAAALLAVFPPDIHFSRLGLNNIADPFFGTWALALLAYGLCSKPVLSPQRQRLMLALAGMCLGLTHYFYEGGRLLFTPLAVAWVLWLILTAPEGIVKWFKRYGWHVAGFALVTVAIALPFYATQWGASRSAAPRLQSEGVLLDVLFRTQGLDGLRDYFTRQLLPTFLHLVYSPDGSAFFYGGNTPLVLTALLPAFLLGAFHVLWRPLRPGVLLALWVLFTVLGESLIDFPDWTARFVVVFPALTLLIAVGIRATLRIFRPGDTALTYGVMASAVVVFAVIQLGYYFGPHLEMYLRQSRLTPDYHDAMFRSRDFPAGTQVYLIMKGHDVFLPHIFGETTFFKMPITVTVLESDETLRYQLTQLPTNTSRAFFVRTTDLDSQKILAQQFNLPPAQTSPYNVPYDLEFLLYFMPAGAN